MGRSSQQSGDNEVRRNEKPIEISMKPEKESVVVPEMDLRSVTMEEPVVLLPTNPDKVGASEGFNEPNIVANNVQIIPTGEHKCGFCNIFFSRFSKLKFHYVNHHFNDSGHEDSDSEPGKLGSENQGEIQVDLKSNESDWSSESEHCMGKGHLFLKTKCPGSESNLPSYPSTSLLTGPIISNRFVPTKKNKIASSSLSRKPAGKLTSFKSKKRDPSKTIYSAYTKGQKPESETFQKECPQCLEKINTASHSKEHNRVAHEGKKPTEFACLSCHQYFYKKYSFLAHNENIHKHTNLRYDCSKCQDSFSRIADLRRHKKKAHRFKSKYCEVCDRTFRTKLMFECHTHEEDGKVGYKCPHCDKSSDVWIQVREHIIWMHEKRKKTKLCEICGANLTRRQANFHKRICGKDFQTRTTCNICKLNLKTLREKKLHDRLLHSEKESYKCYFCKALFPMKCSLESHVRNHTREKVFKCKKCQKAFSCNAGLRNHVVSICAEDEELRKYYLEKKRKYMAKFRARKIYKCERCGKRFGQKPMLLSHEKRCEKK